MRHKKHSGSNRNNNRSRHGKYRSGGGSGNDSQSLARQKKHAMTQKEKYLTMARDAQVNGERVDAEYFYQHVEHYSRTLADIIAKEGPAEASNPTESAENTDEQAPEDATETDGNALQADDENQESEKPARGRRRKAADKSTKSSDSEIPLPVSVLPDAEPAEQAAAN